MGIASAAALLLAAARLGAPARAAGRIDQIQYCNELRQSRPQLFERNGAAALLLRTAYRPALLSDKTVTPQGIVAGSYSGQDRAADAAWVRAHQERESELRDKADSPFYVAGYDINQWVGYRMGPTGGMYDGDGLAYKVYFEFGDVERDLTPAAYVEFTERLAKAGFSGDSKISTVPGYARFHFNNIVSHAPSMEMAALAERTGIEYFGSKLNGVGRGLDVRRGGSVFDWTHFLWRGGCDVSSIPAAALDWVSYR